MLNRWKLNAITQRQRREKSKRSTRLEEDKNTDDGEKLQVPGFVDLLEDLPEEFTFSELL